MGGAALILLSSSPFDPSSGSSRSLLELARALTHVGRTVHLLGTTAVEAARPIAPWPWLAALGIRPEVDRRGAVGRGCPVLSFTQRGVGFTLLETGPLAPRAFDFPHGVQFTRLLAHTLERLRPEVVITTGGAPPEQTRRELTRHAGVPVVLHVSSEAYLHPLAFEHVDGVIAGSRYLAGRFKEALGVEVAALEPMIDADDIVPQQRARRFVTLVNPTPSKGVCFAARLWDELRRHIPGIRLRIVETRGSGAQFLAALRAGGIAWPAPGPLIVEPLPRTRDLFAETGMLLMPSLAPEPVARLAIEAAAAGVAVVSSGRGALGDRPGFTTVVPIGPEWVAESDQVPPPSVVTPWVEAVRTWSQEHALLEAEAAARAAYSAALGPGPERAESALQQALRLGSPAVSAGATR